MEDKDFQSRMQRVETLIRDIEATADPDTRGRAVELVQSLMEFHGAGLERMMEIVSESGGQAGQVLFADFARDSLVGSMLLLYGLHPVEFETRVAQALDKVRPYLASHKGGVELLGVEEGVVRLRMQGSCDGCPSSAMTLKMAIEEAIYEAAPDVAAIEVEGVTEQPPAPSGLVQLGRSSGGHAAERGANGNGNGKGNWEEVGGLESLAQGSVRAVDVRGRAVLFCRLGETLYAYDTNCPGCGQTLKDARLADAALACPACGQRFDVVQAGRGLDQTHLQLEPFPLLVEQSGAKVALPDSAAN